MVLWHLARITAIRARKEDMERRRLNLLLIGRRVKQSILNTLHPLLGAVSAVLGILLLSTKHFDSSLWISFHSDGVNHLHIPSYNLSQEENLHNSCFEHARTFPRACTAEHTGELESRFPSSQTQLCVRKKFSLCLGMDSLLSRHLLFRFLNMHLHGLLREDD
jgi:hypothetical protein